MQKTHLYVFFRSLVGEENCQKRFALPNYGNGNETHSLKQHP